MSEKYFTMPTEVVLKELQVNKKEGLLQQNIKERQEQYGMNVLPEHKKIPGWLRFLRQFNDVLIYILLIAALITGFLGEYLDMTVIIMVTVINAIIGYVQESKAENALDSIRKMMTSEAVVLRAGRHMQIPSEEITIGDIVILAAGEKVPADIRLFEANNLRVEESALTGESVPSEKHINPVYEDAPLGDRANMVYSSTSITAGSGRGVVVAIGNETEIGKINASIAERKSTETPLMKQMGQFGTTVSIGIVMISVAAFLFGYFFYHYPLGDSLLAVISLAVGAIPEGLPAVISIILALGVQSMAKKKAIVKNLPSVETLGSVSVICTDKTGTLTKNEMTATVIQLKDKSYDVTGTGYAPVGEIVGEDENEQLRLLINCVKTVNESRLSQDDQGEYQITGEPTEACLTTLSHKYTKELSKPRVIDKIPFDSDYKYMAYLVEENKQRRIYIKGAPDRLMYMAFPGNHPERQYFEEKLSEIASEGMRLIAAGYKDVDRRMETLTHNDIADIQFLGLIGIIDPPREASIHAVAECQKAGIAVKMITGDHKETAMAIGKALGIGDGKRALVGRDLDRMNEDELYDAAMDYDVFARTSPENKLQLVKALQKHDEIVAMTGDGVNDAPALKRADIGVAMGIKGTEVSKEAAQMILVDDNFETIVQAVKEGRRVYDNLKKTILFILPTNGSQGLLILAALLLGMAMPLSPIQVLWVNMVMAVTISFALAFEKLESGAMTRKPRPKKEPLMSKYFYFRILLVSVLVAGSILYVSMTLQDMGLEPRVINTITLNALVFALIFHLFNCRDLNHFALNKHFFENKMAFVISGVLILLQLAVTYLPIMNHLLKTAPMEIWQWLIPVGLGIMIFIVIEIEKYFTKNIYK